LRALKTGAEAWAVNMLKRFQGENILWGICESVVVHDTLFCYDIRS